MTRIRKVFKVAPELRARQSLREPPNTSVAAPFDTPSSIVITVDDEQVVCEFQYELGDDEPEMTPEKLGPGLVSFGQISGRVMRIQLSRHEMDDLLRTAEELRVRRLRMSVEPGTPLRRAAHYDLIGVDLLPGLDAFVAEQLRQLRRPTVR